MHSTEHSILKHMKSNYSRDTATSELVKNIFNKESRQINEKINSDFTDRKEIRRLKQLKARLHRNILYHLNRLVSDGLIIVSKHGDRGEKYFRLNIEEGEEIIIEKKYKRIVISRPRLPAIPVEGFERQGIIYKFEPNTWINRLNALFIKADKLSTISQLKKSLKDVFSDFNDVIGIDAFEGIIQSANPNEPKQLLKHMFAECEEFGRKITLVINVEDILNEKPIIDFITELILIDKDDIKVIFDTTLKDFRRHTRFFEKIISLYSDSGQELYIKNSTLHTPPYLLGRAGPYTFTEDDWEYFKNSSKNVCIPLASTSIAVDVKKFFETGLNIRQFRRLINNILKTLLIANSSQRTRSSEYFKNILKLNMPYSRDLFKTSRNYIRFWNYGWKQEGLDQGVVLELIKSTKKEVDKFCLSETSIFKSCGMPTDFKMAFSCAYTSFDERLSDEVWRRLKINSINDLHNKQFKDHLRAKEQISRIFDGGDRMRFVRSGGTDAEEITNEIDHILTVYKLPLFCYDFGAIKGSNLKLTSFFENG